MKTKYLFFIFTVLSLLQCSKQGNYFLPKITSKTCGCEASIKTDSTFYATDVRIEDHGANKVVNFKCADVEIAIASVSDIHGANERCENLYEIRCESAKTYSFSLNPQFSFYDEEAGEIEQSGEAAQKLFFDELKNPHKKYFQLRTNKSREITSIDKLKL